MMKNFFWILLILIASCAHGVENQEPNYTFSVTIPKGWKKLDTDKFLIITKDVAYNQYALVQERPLGKPFKHTNKQLGHGMLPQEAAGIIVDEISSDINLSNFQLIANNPASIAGHRGFKILFTHKDQYGVEFKTLYYGFIRGEIFYNLRYSAKKVDYFVKELATFDKFVASFRLSNM
jgi:hypothetical protein